MTPEVTDEGVFKLELDSMAHIRFEEVFELELDGLNHQNVLYALSLELFTDPETNSVALRVNLEHCFGLSGSFCARRAKVISVEPFTEV